MGRSRGRRLSNWVVSDIKLECYISQSTASDAHSVHLAITRGQEIDIRRLDSFASIVDAWESLSQAKTVLAKFRYSSSQSNDQITRRFIHAVHDTFGLQSNDDAMYEMSGDTGAGLNWIAGGGNPFVDEPPPGVHIEILNTPVNKKYKVFFVSKDVAKNIPDIAKYDRGVFIVGKNSQEFLATNERTLLVYSSYVSAAYAADYVNSRNQDSLSAEEIRLLWYEANLLQGKIDPSEKF